MSDETSQPAPTPTENPISEENSIPMSPQEPMADTPIPPAESAPVEVPPVAPEASPSPEEAVPVKDDIPANEPLNPAPEPEVSVDPNNPNITIEKHGNDVTITEVMEPTAHSEHATAQMAGNEPFGKNRRKNCASVISIFAALAGEAHPRTFVLGHFRYGYSRLYF